MQLSNCLYMSEYQTTIGAQLFELVYNDLPLIQIQTAPTFTIRSGSHCTQI